MSNKIVITTAVTIATLASIATLTLMPVYGAPASFQEAQADYNAGRYAQALSKFEPYAANYPGNALVRYYLGLCHLALNHNSQARQEFQFVASCNDAKLASQARTGLAQLNKLGGVAAASAGPAVAAPAGGASGAAANGTPSPAVKGKLKKVIEFYADW